MDQGNQYQNYGYDNYDQSPKNQSRLEKIFGNRMARRIGSPAFATGALLLAGAAFAGIIMMSYPDTADEAVPVIKAERTAFKTTPDERGGMSVPFGDSTIYQTSELEERAPIENLLAEEEPVDKLEVFAEQAEEEINKTPPQEMTATETEEETGGRDDIEVVNAEDLTEEDVPPAPSSDVRVIKMQAEKLPLAKTGGSVTPAKPEKPEQMHAAASSPETLEFVRNVLDKKDTKKAAGTTASAGAATSMNAIEPAAGAAMAPIKPGDYYVQVGSVTTSSGAETEWGKIQASFSELDGLPHRVERADLGERGIYYRIQAGPMSKESASQLCESIKAQKPGGCLVTQ